MGELLDALNTLDRDTQSEPDSLADQAAQAFRSASQRVNEAIEAVQEPGMPVGRPRPCHATGTAAGVGGGLPGRCARHKAAIITGAGPTSANLFPQQVYLAGAAFFCRIGLD
jgi:hypothetical protein